MTCKTMAFGDWDICFFPQIIVIYLKRNINNVVLAVQTPSSPAPARYPILAEQESFTHPEKEWR